MTLQFSLLTNQGNVFLVGDISSTHTAKMGCLKLTVNHHTSKHFEHTGEMDEGQLRGTGH